LEIEIIHKVDREFDKLKDIVDETKEKAKESIAHLESVK
jgi:hypothetical protein